MLRELLLERKRDPEQEYTLHLFEYCNLRCSFCWQDHENKIGIDTVIEKLVPIEEFLKSEKRDSVVFNAMGGEVFATEIFDQQLLDQYKQLSNGILLLGKKYNKQVKVNWVTNLVTNKIDLIEDLLAYSKQIGLSTDIVTSYDPKGRFNINDFMLFKKNMEYFGNRVSCISMLLNSPNIEYILKDKDPYFKFLYNSGYYIYFDYYMPDESADFQAPSDTQLRDVFKHLIDNYPNVHPIADWIKNDTNYASCRTSKLVLADNTMCLCGNLVVNDVKAIKFYKSKIEPTSNVNIENSFLEKYDCATCEYLNRCSLGCFMQHDNKFREELDECVYKLTHRYIDDVRVRNGAKSVNTFMHTI
jgi:sulfatase maturation enzyme AslB (radical SAM superfamily)